MFCNSNVVTYEQLLDILDETNSDFELSDEENDGVNEINEIVNRRLIEDYEITPEQDLEIVNKRRIDADPG